LASAAETAAAASSGAPVILRVDRVGYAFDSGLRVLDGVSLDLRMGEIVSVVGPSGCGKSTLLRLISGLAAASEGTVRVREPEGDRHPCAMVFQEDTLLPWLRVRDNAALVTKFRRSRRRQEAAPVDELLDMVGLREFSRSYPYQLSGGMKRRLAVVVAVAALPQMLLFDEPFSALDEPTRISVHAEVYALLRRFRIGTVLVTHDLGEALCLSDRILLLSNRPARVVEEWAVPFGTERDMRALRSNPEFLSLYGLIWKALSAQIAGGDARDPARRR
jgi:NitT/TauT family transport system ATP-binding protein